MLLLCVSFDAVGTAGVDYSGCPFGESMVSSLSRVGDRQFVLVGEDWHCLGESISNIYVLETLTVEATSMGDMEVTANCDISKPSPQQCWLYTRVVVWHLLL